MGRSPKIKNDVNTTPVVGEPLVTPEIAIGKRSEDWYRPPLTDSKPKDEQFFVGQRNRNPQKSVEK
jgi:hypothetical protein